MPRDLGVCDRVLVSSLSLPEANQICIARSLRKNAKMVEWLNFLICSVAMLMWLWDGGRQEPERNLNGGSFSGTGCLKCS